MIDRPSYLLTDHTGGLGALPVRNREPRSFDPHLEFLRAACELPNAGPKGPPSRESTGPHAATLPREGGVAKSLAPFTFGTGAAPQMHRNQVFHSRERN